MEGNKGNPTTFFVDSVALEYQECWEEKRGHTWVYERN